LVHDRQGFDRGWRGGGSRGFGEGDGGGGRGERGAREGSRAASSLRGAALRRRLLERLWTGRWGEVGRLWVVSCRRVSRGFFKG
jgi:hypothetical protein